MRLHKDSHVDHGLTAAQLAYVLLKFEGRDSFFIETITLPDDLGQVPCNLFGPIMGDVAIPDSLVTMKPRGDRAYNSRVLSRFSPIGTDYIMLGGKHVGTKRTTSELTVIAGPHDGKPCVLYTMFGGPLAPKEPGDPTLSDATAKGRAEIEASIAFWSQHALVES